MAYNEEVHRLQNAISEAVGRLSLVSLAMDVLAESSPVFKVGPCHSDGDFVVVGMADELKDAIRILKDAAGLQDDLSDEDQSPIGNETA